MRKELDSMTVESILDQAAVGVLRGILVKLSTEDHPAIHFDMARWAYCTEGKESLFGEPNYFGQVPVGVCGTAACMAGQLILAVDKRPPDYPEDSWRWRAEEILDPNNEVDLSFLAQLWFVADWTWKNQDSYRRAHSDRDRARAALDQFEYVMAIAHRN